MDDFDDFDLSSGFDDPADQDIENQSDSELGDFASEASEGLTQDKADFKRTALTIIAIGVILLLLVLSFMRMFGGGKKNRLILQLITIRLLLIMKLLSLQLILIVMDGSALIKQR